MKNTLYFQLILQCTLPFRLHFEAGVFQELLPSQGRLVGLFSNSSRVKGQLGTVLHAGWAAVPPTTVEHENRLRRLFQAVNFEPANLHFSIIQFVPNPDILCLGDPFQPLGCNYRLVLMPVVSAMRNYTNRFWFEEKFPVYAVASRSNSQTRCEWCQPFSPFHTSPKRSFYRLPSSSRGRRIQRPGGHHHSPSSP